MIYHSPIDTYAMRNKYSPQALSGLRGNVIFDKLSFLYRVLEDFEHRLDQLWSVVFAI